MKHLYHVTMTALLSTLCALATARDNPRLTVPLAVGPPKVDGRLDDPCWSEAPALALTSIREAPLKNASAVRVVYDKHNLYVGVRCEEAAMGRLRTAWTHAEERDNAIWQDDCVEVFLDPLSRGTATGAHIVVNSAGVWYDAWDGDRSWDCGLRSGIAKEGDAWTIEIAIPFDDLGFRPKGGERWLVNIGREQKPANELSCLGRGSGNFGNPERYVSMVFSGGGPIRLLAVAAQGKPTLRLRVTNAGVDTMELKAVVRSTRGTKLIGETTSTIGVPRGKAETLELPYRAEPGMQTVSLTVTGATDGTVLYGNDIQVRRPGKKARRRVWRVAEPLYEPLLSDEPTGLVRQGAMYWMPEIDHGKFWLFANQYGVRYVKAEMYDLVAKWLLRPLHNSYVLTTPHYDAFQHYRDRDYGAILYAKPKGAKLPNGVPGDFLPDPAFTEAYLADVRSTLGEYGDVVWAVSFGDEVVDHVEASGIKLFAKHADEYPFIRQVDAEVKARFGHGQFGIPHSISDPNQFRWIAYRRWLTTTLNGLLVRLAETVRTTRPGTYVISDDPVALHHGLDYSAMRGHADIATHQLYPRRDPNFPYFGYLTKVVADLTGIEEIWPCPHVEEYGASFRPEEVLELLSQVVRNGATGYHLYLGDTVGKRKGKRCLMNEFYGAPDRWQVIMAALAEMRRTRKLAFPGADCAVLFATDTVASHPGRSVSEKIPCQYTLLGPMAGVFFRFVDEYQLERDEVDLAAYRAVYVPDAATVRQTTGERLRTYVSGGGTLVVTDPEAFSSYSNGEPADELRNALFGAKIDRPKRRRTLTWRDRELPVQSVAYRFVSNSDGTSIVARFDDGTPAILKHRLGKGVCYAFASSPCTRKALGNRAWRDAFVGFQRELGLRAGRRIWRFHFPTGLTQPPPREQGRCLTNNHITWRSFTPITDANVSTSGCYTYSVRPDSIRDQGGVVDIPFAEGDLTDRREAPTAGDVISKKSKIQDWVVRYKKPDAFDIIIDLGGAFAVNRVRLFYSGPLPGLRVTVSPDARTYTPVKSVGVAEAAPRDVADVRLDFDAVSTRYVKVSFPERSAPGLLVLAELEVWGP